MRQLHSVDGMDFEVGKDAGNHFAATVAGKCSNEPPSELTPTALPPALAKLWRTYDQTVRSGSCCITAGCSAGHATALMCTVQVPITHVTHVGDLHDALMGDQPVLASAIEG